MKYSELRQDIVSGDWILLAPSRRRGLQAAKRGPKRKRAPLKGCPFEDPLSSGQEKPFLVYKDKKGSSWAVMGFENKYPALRHKDVCASFLQKGPYLTTAGIGHQDLIVTKNHDKNFAHLERSEAALVFRAFRERYRALSRDSCTAYVLIFHNWGPLSGASIYHPHYQIITLPIVPPDVAHSLRGSSNYFKKERKCVHCTMIKWEKKEKKRVIYENRESIALAPFVSRAPYEIRIFPKAHLPFFERTPEREMGGIIDALQRTLLGLERKLGDPDYNFFIHTSPVLKIEKYRHYHWHIEILPKVSVAAGFELGTGIEINAVDPDEAAKILKIR